MVMSLPQVGVINDYTVIEAVGRTLASLLMTEMEDPVTVTVASPGEDYGVPVGSDGQELGTSRVNLFLYQVEEVPHSRNMDWVDVGGGKQIPYPLALKLSYMVNIFTPDKGSNLDEHRILGDVMRVCHANPVVDPIYFEGTLNPNEPPLGVPWEELRIIHHPLPLDELAAIWHAINKPYRLSVVYEVSLVLIAPPPHKARRVRRVDVTHVEARPRRQRPVVNRIEPERGYGGDLLTIFGEGFVSPFLKVTFDGEPVKPETTAATRITMRIPDPLPPGLYHVQVWSEEGAFDPVRFEETSPFLYRLEPERRYTEDDDFPKDASDAPLLTLWGGNFVSDPPGTVELEATREGEAPVLFPVSPAALTRNAIRWAIAAEMREGRTTLRVRRNGKVSNPLTLSIPSPEIFRADPDPVTSLPQELVVVGDHFRDGETILYLHPGSLADPAEVDPSEIVPITVRNERELRVTLPDTLADGIYHLVVEVYGTYLSQPFQITVTP